MRSVRTVVAEISSPSASSSIPEPLLHEDAINLLVSPPVVGTGEGSLSHPDHSVTSAASAGNRPTVVSRASSPFRDSAFQIPAVRSFTYADALDVVDSNPGAPLSDLIPILVARGWFPLPVGVPSTLPVPEAGVPAVLSPCFDVELEPGSLSFSSEWFAEDFDWCPADF